MSEHVCGGNGQLSPEARAELDEFRVHLTTHPKLRGIEGCRFCAARLNGTRFRPTRAAPPTPEGEQE